MPSRVIALRIYLVHRKIPKYDDYKLIGRARVDANLALANSNPTLIARGLIDGASVIHKFGSAGDVGLSLVPISTAKTYKTPTIATALELVSDSVNDNGLSSPLGSGALIIRVFGITDWNAAETIEDVTLDGITPVALSNSFLRVYRMSMLTSGTYASDAAPAHSSTITLRETGAGATWAEIIPTGGFGEGQTEIAVYSLPAGKAGYIQHAEVFVEANKTANVLFFIREEADVITAPYRGMQAKIVLRNITESIHIGPESPIGPFIGPCDFGWMGMANAQTANIEIDFEILIYDT